MFTHIGWIPCINGHLDFGLMVPGIVGSFTNDALLDPKPSKINYGFLAQQNHHARRIVLQSKVDWRDTINDNYDGKFRVLLLAEANESDDLDNRQLTGKVFIYPLEEEPSSTAAKSKLPWFENIHAMNNLIGKYQSDEIKDWEKQRTSLNVLYEDTLRQLTFGMSSFVKRHLFQLDFEVSPRGFTKLNLVEQANQNYSELEKYVITRQAFYYIKYSLHSHKHHYSKEDSLTTVVKIEAENGAPSKVEALKMIGQLKRELTNIKRTYSNGGQRVYGEEQGIIAYISSLCASLKYEEFIDKDLYDREKDYLASLSKSFSVQLEKREKREKCTDEIRSVYRVYVAWTFSLISLIWLTSLRGFFTYPENSKINIPLNIYEHISISLVTMGCFYYVYRYQVNRKIRNTIDEKGLIAWVNANYTIAESEFKQTIVKRSLKAFLTSVATATLVLILYFITT